MWELMSYTYQQFKWQFLSEVDTIYLKKSGKHPH